MAYVLHQLLTESAARCPGAEAVRLLKNAITYRELETRSNQLAHALIKSGVAQGDRIGIYLQKSPDAIVSIFGVLKTGACYVPVDANAPGPRLLEIARQCEFRALITSCTLFEKLRSISKEEWPMSAAFFVDKVPDVAALAPRDISFADELSSQPITAPPVNVIGHDLAMGGRDVCHNGPGPSLEPCSVQLRPLGF
jgi:acyl-CoA synthetase (AMP-forming)/AMP-acid ligase II